MDLLGLIVALAGLCIVAFAVDNLQGRLKRIETVIGNHSRMMLKHDNQIFTLQGGWPKRFAWQWEDKDNERV